MEQLAQQQAQLMTAHAHDQHAIAQQPATSSGQPSYLAPMLASADVRIEEL